jgi:hypothetical protein
MLHMYSISKETRPLCQWHHPPTHTQRKYLGRGHIMLARLRATNARLKSAVLSHALEAVAPAPIAMRPGIQWGEVS